MRGRISLELPGDPWTVSLCRRVLRSWLEDLSVDETRLADIELVLSEAAGNVVRHAYARRGSAYRVIVTFFTDRLRLEVTDQGVGFLRASIPHPDEQQLGGRGLWLIEQLADVTTVSTTPGGGCCLKAEFCLPCLFALAAAADDAEPRVEGIGCGRVA